jgi:hypothetical protein
LKSTRSNASPDGEALLAVENAPALLPKPDWNRLTKRRLYLLSRPQGRAATQACGLPVGCEITTVWRTVEPLYGPSTRNQIDNQHNQRDNEQQMDESTAYTTKKS